MTKTVTFINYAFAWLATRNNSNKIYTLEFKITRKKMMQE